MTIHISSTKPWAHLWGPSPLPDGSRALGVVRRDEDCTSGALIEMPTGLFVQGNAGVIRSLPQREVHLALRQAHIGEQTSEAKAMAARKNGRLGGRPRIKVK